MKKTILLAFLGAISALLPAQNCCLPNTPQGMAVFANDKDFQRAHAEPLPFAFRSSIGQDIVFPTPDGQTARAFIIRSAKKSNKWLFVFQEWWGLNDYIRKQSETFYNDLGDVNVLALDMYDGKVASTREDAAKYMGDAKEERLQSIMEGASAFAGKKAKIASVGWCFGGGLSLKSALVSGKKAVGCVMYYGMPVDDVKELKKLKCDVLGIFATKEKWITPEVVAAFEKNMKSAHKKLTVHRYDAEHGFANPSNPNFDKKSGEDAYTKAIAYLKKRFE